MTDQKRLMVLLGQAVAHQRCAAGLTQAALARKIDRSPAYINCLEHGTQFAGLAFVYDVAEALGVEVATLLPRSDRVKKQVKSAT